ncbi:MAG TPA: prolyl oligopeptidase family serine peptidase [Polyangia bacterium]
MPLPTPAPPASVPARTAHPLPCGQWPSPLDAETLAGAALRLASPGFAADGSLLWLEGRPSDGGRTTLVQWQPNTGARDLTSPPFDLRSRVHEYGGGAYVPIGDDVVFVDAKTSALHRQRKGGAPTLLAAPGPHYRFGDLTADPTHNRVLAIAEIHKTSDATPENHLVAIDVATGAIEVLIAGADFYASPCPSRDGRHLAWLSWSHPHMPWDAAALHLAELDSAGRPRSARHIAGDPEASAQQPAFSTDGDLYFLLETGGRWNLHRARGDSFERAELVAAMPNAELGLPPWQLGTRTWDFLDRHTAVAAAISDGETSLVTIDLGNGAVTRLPARLAHVAHLAAQDGRVLVHGGLADRPSGILLLETSPTTPIVLRSSLGLALDPTYVSRAEAVSFPTTGGETAHGFFYPPRNPQAEPRPGELPPLIVIAHGGPTAAATPAFSPLVQYWTTRGLAVLDVNYRGSTGYGRAFRDRLRAQWGVFDVEDCIAGAKALAAAGRVDGGRMAIRGSSAGGFTALAAVCKSDAFHAAASLYGVSDLKALANDTHKFESHYLESLVGPYPAREDLYDGRSPIKHAERLNCPVIFFQGADDRVVPPNQAEMMVAALAQRGIEAALHIFPGEQHGFRRAETLKVVIAEELTFYGHVFGFAAEPHRA